MKKRYILITISLMALLLFSGCSQSKIISYEEVGEIKEITDTKYDSLWGVYICTIEFDNGKVKRSNYDQICVDYHLGQSVYSYTSENGPYLYYSTDVTYILNRME